MGGGGVAQRPFWRVNAPQKTDARSARARAHAQNSLVYKELHESFLERPAFFIGSEVSPVNIWEYEFLFFLQCVSTVSKSREIKVLMLYSMDGTEQEFVKN